MGALWRDIAHEVTSRRVRRSRDPGCRRPGLLRRRRRRRDGDLRRRRRRDVTATAHVIHDGIRTFALSDKPIVAAVQGAVAGGGLGPHADRRLHRRGGLGEVREQVREHRADPRPRRLDAAARRDRPAPRAAAAAAGPHARRPPRPSTGGSSPRSCRAAEVAARAEADRARSGSRTRRRPSARPSASSASAPTARSRRTSTTRPRSIGARFDTDESKAPRRGLRRGIRQVRTLTAPRRRTAMTLDRLSDTARSPARPS